MIKAKNGKLVRLCKDDQEFIWEAYQNGGTNVVYRCSYGNIKKAHALLITDKNGQEVCALISENVSHIVALTGTELVFDGMHLTDFITKYCPDFANSL